MLDTVSMDSSWYDRTGGTHMKYIVPVLGAINNAQWLSV